MKDEFLFREAFLGGGRWREERLPWHMVGLAANPVPRVRLGNPTQAFLSLCS